MERHNKRVYLRAIHALEYISNSARVLVVENTMAGRAGVYDLLVPSEPDPIVIGRELDLATCRYCIERFQVVVQAWCLANGPWFGDRKMLQKVVRIYSALCERKNGR